MNRYFCSDDREMAPEFTQGASHSPGICKLFFCVFEFWLHIQISQVKIQIEGS